MGDAQLEMNKPKEAADLYAKAADHNANEYFSPGYLLKEATARELAKDNDGALQSLRPHHQRLPHGPGSGAKPGSSRPGWRSARTSLTSLCHRIAAAQDLPLEKRQFFCLFQHVTRSFVLLMRKNAQDDTFH
ncbi:MAG: hypothetical protein WKG07_24465 [Hymenobacter sp.]